MPQRGLRDRRLRLDLDRRPDREISASKRHVRPRGRRISPGRLCRTAQPFIGIAQIRPAIRHQCRRNGNANRGRRIVRALPLWTQRPRQQASPTKPIRKQCRPLAQGGIFQVEADTVRPILEYV